MRARTGSFVATLIAGLALTLGASSCGGDGGPAPMVGCRSNAACGSGYYCAGPNDRPRCGVPPREGCADSASCGPAAVCSAIVDSCSPDGIGSQCDGGCTATSCGAGLRCNAKKACEPIPCDEGFACPGHQRCDAVAAHAMGPVHARTNGCVDITCAMDKDCPAGKACVNSACADGPGMCVRDLPVP